MKCYDYHIAGLLIRCNTPFSLNITAETVPFVRESGGDPDLTFTFCPVAQLPQPGEGGTWMESALYQQGTVWFRQFPGAAPYARVTWQAPKRLQCDFLEGAERLMNRARNVVDLMSLETVLLGSHGLLLHAAFIRWQGQGILFSGPSGVGKSTQAALWEAHCGSQTINGDRAALRLVHGKWTAWGLPYAGTSGIYRNESAPLAAIVMLQQGQENQLRRLSDAEAFRLLYPEVTIHRWEPEFTRLATDYLLELLAAVPVYRLVCRPDEEAVDLLRRALPKGESL